MEPSIAFPEDREVVTMPVDHVSNQIDGEVLDWLDSLPGYSLNLGAGATTRRPSRCVELEYSVFANTTVVGDAHQLPFEDDAFDAVVSYNTFEHLADPAAAGDEIYRVLKPGGSLRLQTAFLQPLHEEPAHFYNVSEYGLRRWFSNFDIHDCFVPQNMIPPYALGWMSEVVLSAVGVELGPDELTSSRHHACRIGSVPGLGVPKTRGVLRPSSTLSVNRASTELVSASSCVHRRPPGVTPRPNPRVSPAWQIQTWPRPGLFFVAATWVDRRSAGRT